MKHWALLYDLAPDYLERRAAFREAHLALAWAAVERGELVLGGAFSPADTSLLVFRGPSPEIAEAFARADPYVLNGLVRGHRVREWLTVVGDLAATPIRPRPSATS